MRGPLPGPIPATPGPAPAGATADPAPRHKPDKPSRDAFYRQPSPAALAPLAAGTLIRYRPIVARAYRIRHVRARGWQFVYRSTNAAGQPVADVATLLIPPQPKARLLSYQVAYDALNPLCAPSQETLRGTMIEQWFVNKALARGWPVVLPDHEGPALAYLSGRNAGYAVLDAIRGARRFAPTLLGAQETPIALWGYSGGAFASLWAGQMAPRVAPDLNIVGIAAGGVPANLLAMARHLDGSGFAGIEFQAMLGLARAHPDLDLDALLNAHGRKMQKRLSRSCLGQELAGVRDPLLSGYSFAHLRHYTRVPDLLGLLAVRHVIAINQLGGEPLAAPLYDYQGWFDPLIKRDSARALARRYCDLGTPVSFHWSVGGHLATAFSRGSDAVTFLADRFANQPVVDDCPSIRQRWPQQISHTVP